MYIYIYIHIHAAVGGCRAGTRGHARVRRSVGVHKRTVSCQKFSLETWAHTLGDLNLKGHALGQDTQRSGDSRPSSRNFEDRNYEN